MGNEENIHICYTAKGKLNVGKLLVKDKSVDLSEQQIKLYIDLLEEMGNYVVPILK